MPKLLAKWLSAITTFFIDFIEFFPLLFEYVNRKTVRFGNAFEKFKKQLVAGLIVKRGRFTRPFLHLGVGSFFAFGVIAAPIFATSYPIFSKNSEIANAQSPSAVLAAATEGTPLLSTEISPKPRDKIITYTTEKGDTLSSVAQKFDICVDAILWQNSLTDKDNLSVGQELQILPVCGVAHKVLKGDTVYTIAKKYGTEAQSIVDFPFNDFADPDTFQLTAGQTIIVPGGTPPDTTPKTPKAQPKYIVDGKGLPGSYQTQSGSGGYIWPTNGIITQYPAWYHMAYDIANNAAPPVVAAKAGTVSYAGCIGGGYGCHIILDNGGGWQTLYAHLSQIGASVGQSVSQGQVIGRMGSTGRSTGTHLHFEVRKDGVLLNPMNFLK